MKTSKFSVKQDYPGISEDKADEIAIIKSDIQYLKLFDSFEKSEVGLKIKAILDKEVSNNIRKLITTYKTSTRDDIVSTIAKLDSYINLLLTIKPVDKTNLNILNEHLENTIKSAISEL